MENTPNLNLPLYDLDDMANLDDGYNNAMRIIDNEIKEVNDKFPITSDNIGANSINTVNIANGAVTTDKIASAAVTLPKIASDAYDLTPTKNSAKLVTSGSVYDFMNNHVAGASKLLIFGDSWANPTTSYYYNWGQKLADYMNCSFANYGNGGATFTTSSTDPAISIQAQATQAIVAETRPQDVRYIAIVGGVNDLATSTFNTTQYCNAVKSVYGSLHSAFPNAKIIHLQNCCMYKSDNAQSAYRVNNLYSNLSNISIALDNCFSPALCTLLLANEEFFNADLLHLTSAGNNVMVQEFLHEFGFRGPLFTKGNASSNVDYSAMITASATSLTIDFQKYASATQANFSGTMDAATETAIKAILLHRKNTLVIPLTSTAASTGDLGFIYSANDMNPTIGVFHKPESGSIVTGIQTYTL